MDISLENKMGAQRPKTTELGPAGEMDKGQGLSGS